MNERKLSRRTMLKAMGFTVGAAALAACAPPAAAPAGGGEAVAGEPLNLELWTFVNTHARWFESMAEDYKADVNSDFNLEVTEIAYGDMHDKLQIALQSGGVGAPDLADIEQGRFGGFLRGADPGLVDLKDWLAEGGYNEDLVESRQALYTYQGKVYGVEHTLTPVVLYYRHDVWGDAGVDMEGVATWDDYISAASSVVSDGVNATDFPEHDTILRQRGADYFDVDGNVTLDSDLSIETMNWILGLRDEHGIAAQSPGGDAWWAAVRDGSFVSRVGADWYAGFFKDNVPELEGKWMAMPMPAWTPDGVRTSCRGGTGNCIVKTSNNVDAAWDFMQYSMLSEEGNVRRFEMTSLFPPYIPAMTNERLHAADDYFNGQDLGAVFAEVGPDVPAQYQSPYRAEMNAQLSAAWQDIYDGNREPDEVFAEVAEAIRDTMAQEQG